MKGLLVSLFSLVVLHSGAQENKIPKVVFGARLDVNAEPYAYSLKGVALFGQRHALSLGPSLVLNTNPFKEKNDFGACINYDFYLPKLGIKKLNLVLQANVQYYQKNHVVNVGGREYKAYKFRETWVVNTIGIGVNTRLSSRLYLQATTSFLVAYYHDDPGVIFWTHGPHKNPVTAFNKYWAPCQLTLAATYYFCGKLSPQH